MREFLINLCYAAPAVIIALTLHEYAHAQVAYWLGDRKIDKIGRLTLNPIRHLDPIGSICFLFFGFGWAKPVPVQPERFKRPRLGLALTSIAGPLMNIILAFLGAFFYVLAIKVHLNTPVESFASTLVIACGRFCKVFCILNLNFALFNILPIPPLDGSKALYPFLPQKAIEKIEKYMLFILIALFAILFIDSRFLGGNITYGFSFLSNKIFEGFITPFVHIFL